MKKSLIIILFLFACIIANASVVNKRLIIKGDSLSPTHEESFPYLTFNETDLFSNQNPVITLNIGDSLNLWLINNDSASHEFAVKGVLSGLPIIPSGDSLNIIQHFTEAGNYIYYDPFNYPSYVYCGLGGMIAVIDHNHSSHFWNLKTHQSNWNSSILNGSTVDWNSFNPDYYTINGNSFPDINSDTLARIEGQTGDTIMLYISNSGQSIHSLHFHGYHAEICFSSKDVSHVGRIKDTFPIYKMETLVLKIVPDKPGEYPIHDHNLVAVSGNGIYPNGMLTTILIEP